MRISTESQCQLYCNGHHDRMRGIPRHDAPQTLREFWLDGWDMADGELRDLALNAYRNQIESNARRK